MVPIDTSRSGASLPIHLTAIRRVRCGIVLLDQSQQAIALRGVFRIACKIDALLWVYGQIKQATRARRRHATIDVGEVRGCGVWPLRPSPTSDWVHVNEQLPEVRF